MENLDIVDKAVLELYKRKIENLALNKINEDFFNSGSAHALIVLNTIAKHAIHIIRVLAGNLCTSISNDKEYLSNLRLYLSNGGKMQVLLCDFEGGDDHFNKDIYKLFREYPESVSIKMTKSHFETQNGTPIHFTVADSSMYRIETDIVEKVARGNFNDKKNSTVLENVFDQVFNSDKSSKISFPE